MLILWASTSSRVGFLWVVVISTHIKRFSKTFGHNNNVWLINFIDKLEGRHCACRHTQSVFSSEPKSWWVTRMVKLIQIYCRVYGSGGENTGWKSAPLQHGLRFHGPTPCMNSWWCSWVGVHYLTHRCGIHCTSMCVVAPAPNSKNCMHTLWKLGWAEPNDIKSSSNCWHSWSWVKLLQKKGEKNVILVPLGLVSKNNDHFCAYWYTF